MFNFFKRKNYRIDNFESNYLTPEETLLDSIGQTAQMEAPITLTVAQLFYALIALVFIFFLTTAFKLQIVDGADYSAIALSNRSALYQMPAIRGSVFDSKGKLLAGNQPIFDLVAITADLPRDDAGKIALGQDIGPLIGLTPEEVFNQFKARKNEALFFIKKDIAKEQVLQIENLAPAGIYVISRGERKYPLGIKLSAILGYTSKVSPTDLASDPYFNINDRRGQGGIEEEYENALRGQHGRIFFDRANRRYQLDNAKPGNSVVLNVDAEVQAELYDALNNTLRAYGLRFGAAAVQEVNSGAVLGLVSFPTYNNDELAGNLSQEVYDKYFTNPSQPLFNRAIGGRYSPGSSIKPLLALAGLKEEVITPRTTITDETGYITVVNKYNPDIVYKFHDFRIRGTIDLKAALAVSSNIYFYSVGGGYGDIGGLGYDRLEKYFRTFLIDKRLGIDLPGENTGFVPNEEWKLAKTGQPWFVGDTYNTSIGQGDLSVTPLWLSSYAAALANGGSFYQPRVAKSINTGDGQMLESFPPQVLTQLPFDRALFTTVREAMREVVLSGTGTRLKDLPVAVAAKTGTTEVIKGGKTNSTVILYAPYDNPQIAMSVVIEDTGENYGLAVQAAKDFLQWYFTRQ